MAREAFSLKKVLKKKVKPIFRLLRKSKTRLCKRGESLSLVICNSKECCMILSEIAEESQSGSCLESQL